MDKSKILATAKQDIKRAEDYYKEVVEQPLIERYEVYYSDRERYSRKYPKLSEKSDIRTFDFWSAVEWMLPNMLKAFFGSNRIISISGAEGEDADRAEKIMKLIQWQLTVKNQGYRQFKSWFGDALAVNLGILKCYWKRETKQVPHRDMLDRAQLVGLLQDGRSKIIRSQPFFPLGMVEVEWEEQQYITNAPVIESIRPSDIRFTPDGRTLAECSMVAHRKVVTIDHLRREARRGLYDADIVEEIAAASSDEQYEPTELELRLSDAGKEAERRYSDSIEAGRRRVVLHECYLKTDIDDDGLLDDAIVTVCNDMLLRAVANPYGRVPFFELVPFWDSYQIWGRMGLCEVIQDTQDSHTAIWRQMLVALGLSNQWRCVVDEKQIHMEDLAMDAMFIRAKTDPKDAFMPMPHAGLNPENFQFLEYCKSQLEEWTPITRYNQGLDASSLNKTASGINMIMSASQQRQEEIIRNFAETGISELYRFLIQLNQRYMDQEQLIRLQNEAMQVTPDDLSGEFDLSVDAGTGLGAIDSKVQVLTSYLRELYPFAMQIGCAGQQQFVYAARKLMQLMGIEDAEKYIVDPTFGGMPIGQGAQGYAAPAGYYGGAGADRVGGAGLLPPGAEGGAVEPVY